MAGVMHLVHEIMDRPWRWGQADCCTAACDVFQRLHGTDPMASLRGLYASREGAERIIASRGGMVAMATSLAATVGLVNGWGEGSIGVSEERPEGRCLMICVGMGRWAAKSPRGFVIAGGVVAAWRP